MGRYYKKDFKETVGDDVDWSGRGISGGSRGYEIEPSDSIKGA
jgi:hypothetical protein